jgi:hypothetical protein
VLFRSGCVALAGLAADWRISQIYADHPPAALRAYLVVWGGVFLVALAGVIGLTRLREIRKGMPFWSPAKRKVLATILPPFLAGVGLTAAIALRSHATAAGNEWGLIPAIWMIFYGLACWQVGAFSLIEVRVMGAAFILAACITAASLQANPYWALGLTFGAFHIVYGIVVWIRHGG